jgi:hypothetical protein
MQLKSILKWFGNDLAVALKLRNVDFDIVLEKSFCSANCATANKIRKKVCHCNFLWHTFPFYVGFYGTLLDSYGTLLSAYGTLFDPHGTLLDPHGTLLDPYGTLLDPYGTLL